MIKLASISWLVNGLFLVVIPLDTILYVPAVTATAALATRVNDVFDWIDNTVPIGVPAPLVRYCPIVTAVKNAVPEPVTVTLDVVQVIVPAPATEFTVTRVVMLAI